MASEVELQLLRLKIQIDILQSIIFQIALFATSGSLAASSQERQQQLLARLEEVAQKGELHFLQNERRSDAERALYAEEFREVVEQMKKSLLPYK